MLNKSRFLKLTACALFIEIALIASLLSATLTKQDNAEPLPTQMVLPVASTQDPENTPSIALNAQKVVQVSNASSTEPTEQGSTPTSESLVGVSVAPTNVLQPTSTNVLTNLVPSPVPTLHPSQPFQVPIPQKQVPNQVVIQFKPDTKPEEKAAYIASLGGTVSQQIDSLNTVVINLPSDKANQQLPESAQILQSEPDYFVSAQVDSVQPNDPLYAQQWALSAIGAPDAWQTLPADAPKVTVAVIDSGICAGHPDLKGRILPGWDFIENDAVPQDEYGHGCGVAGIIAANANDGIGIAGVAPNAVIMPLRVLDGQGIGTYSNVAAAIVYAADHGAQVINLSLGGALPSAILESAVNYAVGKGVTVVAAAGNTGGNILYPAAYEPVIAVGSVDQNLQLSSFSAYLPQLDLLAPGRDIITTSRDDAYAAMSGTSFATPYVAGAEAVEIVLGQKINLGGGVLSLRGIQQSLNITATPYIGSIPTSTPITVIAPSETPKPTQTPDASSVEADFWRAFTQGRWTLPENQLPHIALINRSGNKAVIWIGFIDATTRELLQIPATPVPATLSSDQTWIITFPGETDYDNKLIQLPNDLIPHSVLSDYTPSEVSAQAVQNAGYYPWHGLMKVTQDRQNTTNCTSYSHCIGGSDEWAWDFGNTTSGWEVYAARSGKIAWIDTSHATNSGCTSCLWTTANVIVIDFGDGYAGIYMHLAKEAPSRFQIGAPVSTGQLIGYADSTGRTSGPHLHYAIQPWNSTWNGNSDPSIWYRHSAESLFQNESTGNPTYPNQYTSHIPDPGSSSSCTTPNPNADQVVLFVDPNYGGACTIKGIGDYTNPAALGIANDQTSSLKVGPNVEVELCENDGYGTPCRTFTADNSNIDGFGIGVSSAHVRTRGVSTGNWIATFYEGTQRWDNTSDSSNQRCTVSDIGSILDKDYGGSAPCTGMSADNWIGDYTAVFNFSSNNYYFRVEHDDGARLWIDGVNKADYGGSGSDLAGCNTGIALTGNHTIRVMLRENTGSAKIKVNWIADGSGCTPTTSQYVELCTSDNAGSGCYRADTAQIYDPIVLQGQNLNDQTQSVKVPAGRSILVFRAGGLTSTADCYNTDRVPLPSGTPWDLKGQVSSIQVFQGSNCPTNELGTVLMYAGTQFGNGWNWGMGRNSGLVNVEDIELGHEVYNNQSLFNDQTESMRIPNGWSVRVYAGANGNAEGRATPCLTGDVGDLNANGWNLNNQISSIEIFNNNTTCTSPIPSAPNLNATADTFDRGASVTLSWSATTNGAEYYAELVGGQNVNTSYGWTANISWPVGTNLSGGTYQWRVKARNSQNQEGPWTAYSTFTVRYGAPTNLSATAISTSQINLSWGASADAPTNITNYNIFRDGTGITSVNPSTTTFADSGVSCGTTYTYVVRAFKNGIESPDSNTATVITPLCQPTAPLTPVINTPVDGSMTGRSITVNFTWGSSAGATAYYLQFNSTGGISGNSGWISGTSYSFSFTHGGQYQWTVKARNASGESATSDPRMLYVVPAPPSNLLANLDTQGQAVLTWTAAPDYAPNLEGYAIYRNGTFIAQVAASTLTFTDVNLVCSTQYSYIVRTVLNSTYALLSNASNTAQVTGSCAPSNDRYTNAKVISSFPYIVSQQVTGATVTADEPVSICQSLPQSNLVWYKYTPDVTRGVFVDTSGSSYNTIIGVYTNPANWNGSFVTCANSAFVGYAQTSAAFRAVSGYTYYIGIANFGSTLSTSGNLLLSIEEDNAPPTGQMTAPVKESHTNSNSVVISTNATDSISGIKKVDFYGWADSPWSNQQWVFLGTDTSAPFSLNWNVTNIPDSGVFLSAELTDNAGNVSAFIWDPDWTVVYLDKTPPSSVVNSLAAQTTTATFNVSWSGSDNFTDSASLIYDVQYRDNGGAWTVWQTTSNQTNADFTGVQGHTYGFRSRARDLAGNWETYPTNPDATTTVQLPPTNDNYGNAFVINALPYNNSQDINNSTVSNDEPALCANLLQSNVVWYKYTSNANRGVVVDTTGSGYDTILGVYTNPLDWSGSLVTCIDDTLTSTRARLGFQAFTGVTYYIGVGKYYSVPVTTSTTLVLSVTEDNTVPTGQITTPANNTFTNQSSILLQATASDNSSGVKEVEFYAYRANWNPQFLPLFSDQYAPYEYVWDVSGITDGPIVIGGFVRDNAGNNVYLTTPYNALITLDRLAPSSSVSALSATSAASFTVNWSGSDAVSGITSYDVQYQDNGGVWIDWQTGLNTTTANFTGMPGHIYGFRSRAHDKAGNVEDWPVSLDTQTSVPALPALTSGVYDERNPNIAYSAGWLTYNATGPANNTIMYTNVLNASVEFRFNGSGITISRTLAINRGLMEVCIDNACQTLDNYSYTTQWNTPVTIDLGSVATRLVRIRNLSTSFIDLDAVQVLTPLVPLITGVYQENNQNLIYSGNWISSAITPSALGGAWKYTNDPNGRVRFSIDSTVGRVVIYRTTYMTGVYGSMQVYVDNVLTTTINNTSSGLIYAVPFTFSVTSGGHTIELRNVGSTYSGIDQISLLPAATPLTVGTYQETDSNLDFSGVWLNSVSAGPLGGSRKYTSDPNATVTFNIDNTVGRVTIYRTTYVAGVYGSLQVFLDGSTTPFTTISNTTPAFLYGQPFTFAVTPGNHIITLKNVGSTYSDLDQITLQGAAAPLTVGTYQEMDSNLIYNGTWLSSVSAGPLGGSRIYTSDPNATVTFNIDNTVGRVTIYRTTYVAGVYGAVQVYLDNNPSPFTTISNTSTAFLYGQPFTFAVIPGSHTITLKNVGSTYSDLDQITLAAPTTLSASTYQETDSNLIYNGTWTANSNASALGGARKYTNDPNASLSFAIDNTVGRVTIYRATYLASVYGSLQVFLDNNPTPFTTINNVSSSLLFQQPFTFAVTPGNHIITLKNVGSTYSDIDQITLSAPPTTLSVGTYEETDSNLIYNGAWLSSTTTGPLGGSRIYTSDPDANVSFAIDNTVGRVTIYRTTYAAGVYGSLQVYLDGSATPFMTINNTSSAFLFGQPFTFAVTPGSHTITLKNVGSTYSDLDRIVLQAATTPLTVGTYQEDNAALIYNGTWLSTTGQFGNRKYTSDPYGNMIFTIDNSVGSITLYRTIYAAGVYGSFQVFLDNSPTPFTTINNTGTTFGFGQPFTFTVTPGNHIITLKNVGSTYSDIDQITLTAQGAQSQQLIPTATLTPTDMPVTATSTLTPSGVTPTTTGTAPFSQTPTETATSTQTATAEPTQTMTPTETVVPSVVPTNIPAPTIIPTDTLVPTEVPTSTPLPTVVPTNTPIPTEVPTSTTIPTDMPTETSSSG